MKKLILGVFAIGTMMQFTSCGKVSDIVDSAAGIDYNTTEGASKTQERLVKNFGGKEVYEVDFSSRNELSSSLQSIDVKYVENDKSYSQSMYDTTLNDPKVETTWAYKENKDGKIKVEDLDLSVMPSKFAEAVKIIETETDEFHNFNLYRWDFELEKGNKVTARFTINATKKGEGNTMQGRNIVTNYYEFNFDMDANGKVTLDE